MLERIKNVFGSFDVKESNISPETSLEELGFDSLMLLELVVALEEEFHITFDDSDLISRNFETVATIEKIIEKYT